MKRLTFISTVLLICGAGAATAQESVQTVRDLYAAAAYEDALAAVNRLQSDPPQREIEHYRVFSLTALGRKDEARKAMETLVSADPLFQLDPAETPPRVQEAFLEVRKRLLPDLTKHLYLEARAALDRKERAEAIARFEKLLKIIDSAGATAASVGELRILAAGFLDLSRALAEPAPEPAAVPSAPPNVEAVRAAVPDMRPIAVEQDLPPWFPGDPLTRRSAFSGSVRVQIGADGRVESAEILRSVHPTYDGALLQAARRWLYQPATRNGAPVAAEITVEVNLRPLQ